jgi:hypothetical protein
MKKMVGYVLMGLGVLVMFLQLFGSRMNINILGGLSASIAWIVALGLLGVGLVITLGKQKPEQAEHEVPIYHGEKIVGYRRKA